MWVGNRRSVRVKAATAASLSDRRHDNELGMEEPIMTVTHAVLLGLIAVSVVVVAALVIGAAAWQESRDDGTQVVTASLSLPAAKAARKPAAKAPPKKAAKTAAKSASKPAPAKTAQRELRLVVNQPARKTSTTSTRKRST